MGYEPANRLSEGHAVGLYSTVAMFQDESGQQELSQVLLTLRAENTRAFPPGAFDKFELPNCDGHILTPDPGVGVPFVASLIYCQWASASGKKPVPCTAIP